MPFTPKMQFPYPGRREEDWFAKWEDFANAVDQQVFGLSEDRNMVVTGGGAWSFDSVSGSVSWSEALEVLSPSTGVVFTLPAGSMVLADGQVLAVEVAKGATSSLSVEGTASLTVSPRLSSLVLGIRRGAMFVASSGRSVGATRSRLFGEEPKSVRQGFVSTSGQTDFVLTLAPLQEGSLDVFQDGLLLGLSEYSLSSSTVTLVSGPDAGVRVDVRYLA